MSAVEEDGVQEVCVPDEILVLPLGTDTGDLEDQSTIIFQEIVDLAEELTIAADTDMLSHLEGNNLVVLGAGGNLTVIAAEDAGLVRRYL